MIPLILHYVKAFFWDQNAAKRFLVGLGAMLASVLTAVAVFGLPAMSAWTGKEWAQHIIFVLMSTLATMLPGPAIAKPSKLVEVSPPRGFAQFALVAGIATGVAQALIFGLALHSLKADAHPWALLCLAAGGAQGWSTWRALR